MSCRGAARACAGLSPVKFRLANVAVTLTLRWNASERPVEAQCGLWALGVGENYGMPSAAALRGPRVLLS
jgi:hypothetical protein